MGQRWQHQLRYIFGENNVDSSTRGVSSAMDENKQKRKWLNVEHKALKWVKTKSAPSKGLS